MNNQDHSKGEQLKIDKEALTLIKKSKEFEKKVYQFIDSLDIPKIACKSLDDNGFIVNVGQIDNIDKSVITDNSICVYYTDTLDDDEDHPDLIKKLVGETRIINVYLRLGNSNTWIYSRNETLIGDMVNDYENQVDDEKPDYHFPVIDQQKINSLSTIVAKAKGFSLLKNKEQRKMFASEVLESSGKEFEPFEMDHIVTTSLTFYEFGILPIEAKKLSDEGNSISKIAKLLAHTNTKIEKALLCKVPATIRQCIEDFDRGLD